VLKVAFFCMGLMLAAVPLAASAQITPPTPPPAAQSDVKPTPAPPERFLMVDGSAAGFGGKTYNELAAGASTGGWGIRAVDEVPVIGHNWVAQIDYRSYNYQHSANGAMANGITFACPTGDPGCVTPIGYQTYDRVLSPGPMNYVNALNAQESTTQLGFGSKIAPIERFYVSVGYVFKNTNYLGYPGQSGMGFGLDKLPDVDRALSLYGNFWIFFNVGGNYTGPTAAGLGGFSGYPFVLAYRLYTYRLGATFNLPKTKLFLDASFVGDRADASVNAPSDEVHNMLFLGAGTKF
jgi:hypothetical protein